MAKLSAQHGQVISPTAYIYGEMFFFFENVLLAGEILKKLKMLKVGGTMFVSRVCTNIVPPTFNIFNFFRISPARSTFSKKFLTFPQPEAFSKKKASHRGNVKNCFCRF